MKADSLIIQQEKTFIRGLGKDIVKAVVISTVLAIFTSVGAVYAVYYKTTNKIDNIVVNDEKQDAALAKYNHTLNQINEKLGSTNTVTAVSDEKIKGLENQIQYTNEQMKLMQQTQLEMLKMLGEIKRK